MMLSTAENLVKGRGLIDYRGMVLTQFPPLYSVLMALGSSVSHQNVFNVGWALNIIVFAALVWSCGRYFYVSLSEEPILAYFASFVVCSSTSLITISANIASDPLFMLIVVLFLMNLSAYLKFNSMRYLVFAAILAVIACFQRYAGLSLVIVGALVIAYKHPSQHRDLILRVPAFTLLTGGPILLWGYLHNAPVSGTAFGGRLPAMPALNFLAGVEKVLYWFMPLRMISFVGPLVLLGLILCILILGLIVTKATGVIPKLLSPQILPNAIFLIIYGAVLVFDISYFELKGISTDRVHIVALPSLLLVAFALVVQPLTTVKSKFGAPMVYGIIATLFLLWTIYPIARTYSYVHDSSAAGDISPYNSINKGDIRDSALAHYLMSLDLHDQRVYSNGGDSAWFILHRRIDFVPMISSDDRLTYLEQHYNRWPGKKNEGYLVWFNSEAHKVSYATPEELNTIALLRELYSDQEGAVYFVSTR